MRIGVALSGMSETIGGGFTFERAVLDGLLKRGAHARHEFRLLGEQASWGRDRGLPPNAEYLPAPSSIAVARAWLENVAPSRLLADPRERALSSAKARSAALESSLSSHGVQCLLHLTPVTPPAYDTSIPYVSVVWDIEHRLQPYFPELSAHGEWERRDRHYRRVFSRAAAIVTGTEVGRKQLELQYGVAPERVLVLPHPTPSDALAFGKSAYEAPSKGAPTLLYPAQFWAHKNHVGLLHALRILAERHQIRPTLLLAGSDQGNRAHVERRARQLGLSDQVRFLGFVKRERLLNLYAESTALVYPSTFGPENLPPLEAFAIGCPVAAARIPGAEEQLGDAAVLFDPHDHSGMADALYAVMCDAKLRPVLIERGHARAERWTAVHFAESLLAWFDRFALVRDLWP